jgi:hypothetical protein
MGIFGLKPCDMMILYKQITFQTRKYRKIAAHHIIVKCLDSLKTPQTCICRRKRWKMPSAALLTAKEYNNLDACLSYEASAVSRMGLPAHTLSSQIQLSGGVASVSGLYRLDREGIKCYWDRSIVAIVETRAWLDNSGAPKDREIFPSVFTTF